ncbi:MAG: hypothetical protein AAB425_11620 [Bdellovibrionota bacterium]
MQSQSLPLSLAAWTLTATIGLVSNFAHAVQEDVVSSQAELQEFTDGILDATSAVQIHLGVIWFKL